MPRGRPPGIDELSRGQTEQAVPVKFIVAMIDEKLVWSFPAVRAFGSDVQPGAGMRLRSDLCLAAPQTKLFYQRRDDFQGVLLDEMARPASSCTVPRGKMPESRRSQREARRGGPAFPRSSLAPAACPSLNSPGRASARVSRTRSRCRPSGETRSLLGTPRRSERWPCTLAARCR